MAVGRDEIRDIALGLEMGGLDGWEYPYQEILIDERKGQVVGFWKQIAHATRADGTHYEVAGIGGSWFGYARRLPVAVPARLVRLRQRRRLLHRDDGRRHPVGRHDRPHAPLPRRRPPRPLRHRPGPRARSGRCGASHGGAPSRDGRPGSTARSPSSPARPAGSARRTRGRSPRKGLGGDRGHGRRPGRGGGEGPGRRGAVRAHRRVRPRLGRGAGGGHRRPVRWHRPARQQRRHLRRHAARHAPHRRLGLLPPLHGREHGRRPGRHPGLLQAHRSARAAAPS